MGPMAQDFFAAFGLGDSDKHITTVDADGVALAAIRGLVTSGTVLPAVLLADQLLRPLGFSGCLSQKDRRRLRTRKVRRPATAGSGSCRPANWLPLD